MQQVLLNPDASAEVLITQAYDMRTGAFLASPVPTLPGEAIVLDMRDDRGYLLSAVPIARGATAYTPALKVTARKPRSR